MFEKDIKTVEQHKYYCQLQIKRNTHVYTSPRLLDNRGKWVAAICRWRSLPTSLGRWGRGRGWIARIIK